MFSDTWTRIRSARFHRQMGRACDTANRPIGGAFDTIWTPSAPLRNQTLVKVISTSTCDV